VLHTHPHAHVAGGEFPQKKVFLISGGGGGIGKKVLSLLFSGLYQGRAFAQAFSRWHSTALPGLSA